MKGWKLLGEALLAASRFGVGCFLSGQAFVLGGVIGTHIGLIQATGEDAQVQTLKMDVVNMPDDQEDAGDDRLGAVSQLCRWNDPTRQETGEKDGEPDDEAADHHDPDAEEEEPIGHFLFEIIFAKGGLFLGNEEQILEHLPGR